MLRATPTASTRATSPGPGSGRWPTAADLAAGAGRRAAVTVGTRRSSATSSTSAGHPPVAVAVSSASPRAARPRCWRRPGPGPGCPAGTTSPPTTSRRWPGRRCGTGCGCGPEAELEGVTADAVLDGVLGQRPGPPLSARHGADRTAPGCWRCSASWSSRLGAPAGPGSGVRSCCLLLVARRRRRPRCCGRACGRCGFRARATSACGSASRGTVDARRRQPGPAPLRAQVRDAWPPSAGAATQRQPRRRARRASVDGSSALLPDPARRPLATRVTVRALGPLGLAARQGSHGVPWPVRVLPPFPSRKPSAREARPAAGARRPDAGAGAGPGHRVRLVARVRARATTCARSTGAPPPGPRDVDGPHLASGAGPAGCCWCSTPDGRRRVGSATRRASMPRWTLRCCSPRSPPRPATGSTCWPSTGRTRRRAGGALTRRAAGRAGQRDGAARADAGRDRLVPATSAVLRAGVRSARSSCCSPGSTRRRSRRACSPCCPSSPKRHRVVLARSQTRGSTRWRLPAVTRSRSTAPRPPNAPGARGCGCAPAAQVRRRRRGRRPGGPASGLADTYLALKAAGRL